MGKRNPKATKITVATEKSQNENRSQQRPAASQVASSALPTGIENQSQRHPLSIVNRNTVIGSQTVITLNDNSHRKRNQGTVDEDSDKELFDGEHPLNLANTKHVSGRSLAPPPRKQRRTEKAFKISKLDEEEEYIWKELQNKFVLHFFTSTTIMTAAELNALVVRLWRETFSKDTDELPTMPQIRAVRQRLESFFSALKRKVLANVLDDYKLREIKDGPERAHRARNLTLDRKHAFLYPNPEVRKMRYYHPAVLNVLGSLFFHKGGYGKQELPYGGTMKENIPKAAVAWVAAGIHWALTHIDNHGNLPLDHSRDFGVATDVFQQHARTFLAGLKDVDTAALASAVQAIIEGKKKHQVVDYDDDGLDPDDESSSEEDDQEVAG